MSKKSGKKRKKRKGSGDLAVPVRIVTKESLPDVVLENDSRESETVLKEVFQAQEEERPVFNDNEKIGAGSFFAGFFGFFSKLFFTISVLAFAMAAYFIFLHNRSTKDVSLELKAPNEVRAGAPFEASLELKNSSGAEIYSPKVWLDLPEGLRVIQATDPISNKIFGEKAEINNIKPGEKKRLIFQIIAAASEVAQDGEGRVTQISGKMEYALARSSVLELQDDREVLIKGQATQISVQKSDLVLNNSVFEIRINYKNISNFDFEDVAVQVKYPDKFKFVSASVEPSSLNNYWKMGGLRTGAKGEITIQGTLRGAQGASFDFPVTILANIGGSDYPIGREVAETQMAPALLNLTVETNGSENYTAKLGDELKYTIRYVNSSGIVLKNVSMTALVRGEMVDFSSLESAGRLDSSRGVVVWDSQNTSAFLEMQPGAAGSVEFSIKLPNKYPIQRFGDKNFNVRVSVEASSPSVPYYFSGDSTRTEKEVVTKVGGYLNIEAKNFYRDPESGTANGGELPPAVGKATGYTVHWIIRNFSNDASGVKVSAPMQKNVFWKGLVSTNGETAPSYDEAGGEVIWEIPKIQAGRGVATDPIKAVFKIEGVPEAGDVGKFQELMGVVKIRAVDDYTGEALANSDLPISTNLVDDATVGAGMGVVVE